MGIFARSNRAPKDVNYYTPTGPYYELFANMLDQPHLLVAGATGSGKSVVINGLIATLLYRQPKDRQGGAQFILIDPKRVELSAYKRLPHTLKYASEPDTMLSALRYAMELADSRFKVMENRREKKYTGGDIYVVIDEFADLMTTQGKAVVPLVQRLAQLGRAARVHIILATQTPISEILPTKIKCNFDARVGLRTRSDQDSRNIIGKSGLETLPRYGKGYYMCPEEESLYNIPMVSDEKINSLVRWWQDQMRKNGIV